MKTTKIRSLDTLVPLYNRSWKDFFWSWIGFSNQPTLALYPGYGYTEHLVLHGHAFSISPLPRKIYSTFFLGNLFALIRLFIVKPIGNATVKLQWKEQLITGKTDKNGFIKLNWRSNTSLVFGWHTVTVVLLNKNDEIIASSNVKFFVPHLSQFAFISDIDDTFLISHSTNLRKKLAVLFTRNPHTRKPFEGVVKHYRLLASAQTKPNEKNPFFYVSSSEWNLFSYISEFIKSNELPEGILLLSKIKTLMDFLYLGKNTHSRKFEHIARLLNDFPTHKFILLGDSSQRDPYIYQSIVNKFPGRIHAVYIRDIAQKNNHSVRSILQDLEAFGVHCCFFVHSIEAIAHSVKIGLIKQDHFQ